MSHVLMALALLGGYVLFLLVRPQKNCFRCRGWGARGRRRSACRWCGGTGTRFRLGARLAHQALLSIGNHIRDNRKKDHHV